MPAVLPPDEERCPSMRRTVLRRENNHEVYLRCAGRDGHVSRWHRGWLFSWTDEDEDGYLETEYEDDDPKG